MTAYLAATLQNLLLRDAPSIAAPAATRAVPTAGARCAGDDSQPLLFRSEGFAEDLLDADVRQ